MYLKLSLSQMLLRGVILVFLWKIRKIIVQVWFKITKFITFVLVGQSQDDQMFFFDQFGSPINK